MAKKQEREAAATPALARVFSDLPVTTREGLAFEFDGLARTLAELAQNPANQTPFTVVVRGDWGRGKTTLLRQVQRLHEEAKPGSGVRQVRVLWFNAWKYPSEETVLAGLLGVLLDALRTGVLIDQLKVIIDERKDHLAQTLLKLAAPWLDVGAHTARYSEAEERRAFYDAFRRLFAEGWYLWQQGAAALRDTGHMKVEERLGESQQKHCLAILLDDLDRCREDRVLEVMEAINLFLDLPGVCFYLGLDWKRLSELLSKHMNGREEAFLEKIVQVSLDLPHVSDEGVLDYVKTLVHGSSLAEALHAAEEDNDLRVLASVIRSNHPRHVKRVLNDLSMTLAVLRNTGHLGEGDAQLPGQVVVAWHLLHEAMPLEQWDEMRVLRANVQAFLRNWRALDEDAEAEGMPGELIELHRTKILSRHVSELDQLTDTQLDLLVHFGSPPREERVAQGRTREEVDLEELGGYAWVSLEGGGFQMGSEAFKVSKPVHMVELSPFKIARFPVTNVQYQRFVLDTGKPTRSHWKEAKIPEGKENHPVVNVSWSDAEAFCTWLEKRVSKKTRGTVRLPSEAQWEYAASGGKGRAYPWGEEEPTPEHANFGGNVEGTTPVASYRKGATPTGIHDLAGNVWEWCADWYVQYGEKREKYPPGPKHDDYRVLRGGSFLDDAVVLRAAYRDYSRPGSEGLSVGFRVVWSSSGGQG